MIRSAARPELKEEVPRPGLAQIRLVPRVGSTSPKVKEALVAMTGSSATAVVVAAPAGAIEGEGALALVQQVPSIMALIFGFGFAGVNVYYVGSGKKTASEALTDSAFFALIAAIAGVPLSYLVMRLLPALLAVLPPVLPPAGAVAPPFWPPVDCPCDWPAVWPDELSEGDRAPVLGACPA